MSWRAKSALLASDQSLQDLIGSFHTSTGKVLNSIAFGALCLNCMASVLSLSNVEDVRIKWPLALLAFFVGLILGLIWFWYLKRNRWLYKAVKELC